jgi:hypothetical protein
MNKSLRKLAVFSLIAFGVFCFARSMPSSFTHNGVHGVMPRAVASIHSERPALPGSAIVKTRAIQDIRVGQRVLAKNPEISNLERRARRVEPEFSNWLQLSLEMPKSDGSTLHIEMLRSEEWLRNQLGFVIGELSSGERQGVSPPSTTPTPDLTPPSPQTENFQPKTELALLSPLRPIYCDIALATVAAEAEGVELVGLTVDLDLPEMGACGTAIIKGIATTPEIEQGDGRVVTATFRHPPSNTVLDVVFVDEGTNLDRNGLPAPDTVVAPADVIVARTSQPETSSKSIGVTDNHLFWSEDRGEFIEIGRMEIGERVRTLFGETKILAQKLPRPGPPAEVYNLEVHEEHVYFVGDDSVLAHNEYEVGLGKRDFLHELGPNVSLARRPNGRMGWTDDGLSIARSNDIDQFQTAFFEATSNTPKINFNLRGVSVTDAFGIKVNSAAKSHIANFKVTEWELRQIVHDRKLFWKTTFHLDGKTFQGEAAWDLLTGLIRKQR